MKKQEQSEEQQARELEQLHDKILGNSSIDQQSMDSIDDVSINESERLLQMIHLLKNAAPKSAQVDANAATRPDLIDATHEVNVDEKRLQTPNPDISAAQIPGKIGRFEIGEPIGQGGFGVVFRARDPQLNRDVAFKVPRLDSLLTNDARDRFVTEAKTAAALTHPHIVTVYESGRSGPICYMASELIEGPTLADWMKNRSQPVTAKTAARIAQELADALQHAHTRGVIHRDIKPSNILLASTTDSPSEESLPELTRISDFGLAKFIEKDDSQTRTGSLIGTPAYMSPEQVRSDKERIGASTDIYSLGLVLYELLTNHNPFVRDSLIDTMSAVQEYDPTAPSRKNSTVPRDLDAIVLKCLEKKSSARYSTAAEFRDDLGRYLNGEPIQAREITTVTRTAKWIARNRLAATILFLLIAGIFGTTLGLIRARDAEAEAKLAEQAATVEAQTAQRTVEFLEDMFEVSDLLGGKSGEIRGKDITAEDIFKRGAQKIRTDLVDEPEVQARLMTTIGRVMVNLAMYDEAKPLLSDALAMRIELLSPDDPELGTSHRQLGNLYRALEEHEKAEAEFLDAIEIFEKDAKANFRELSGTYNDLGILFGRSAPERSLNAYVRSRDLMSEFDPESENLWALDANIATINARAGQFEKAREAFELALVGAIKLHGEDHPRLGALYGNLSYVNRKLGNFHESKKFQLRDLEVTEKKLGADHPNVGAALSGLVLTCQRLGEYKAAVEYGKRAVAVTEAKLAPDHHYHCAAVRNYSGALMRSGNCALARENIKKLISELESSDETNDVNNWLGSLLLLASIERVDNQPQAALDISRQILGYEGIGEYSGREIDARFNEVLALAQLGHDDAPTKFAETLRAAESNKGIHPTTLPYFEARYWALQGDTDQAIAKLDEAIQAGFHDSWVLYDADLKSIRSDERYKKMAEDVRAKLAPREL